jgi:YihY family inner membrane protein
MRQGDAAGGWDRGETMNPVERVARRLDAAQQRHTLPAFVVAVVKKYTDDNGGIMAAALAHSAFVSIFPLLLVFVTILGLVAASDPALRATVLKGKGAAFAGISHQFPIVGSQLTSNVHALQRSSTIGLIVGLLATIWGCTGLAQTGLFTMQQVWNLPGPARPGYFPRLGRCLLFLIVLVVGLVVTTGMTSLGVFTNQGVIWTILLDTVAAIANGLMFLLVFRVLTPKGVPTSNLVWGAAAGGVAWTVMQALGNFLVGHYLHNDRSVYGVFATVLGLVVWVYFLVQITVYAAEINVVLTRRLWPRAIVQPPLTEADRAVMAAQALQNQRREEQQVKVTYNDRPASTEGSAATPRTPEEIVPPAEPTPRGTDVDGPGRADASGPGEG